MATLIAIALTALTANAAPLEVPVEKVYLPSGFHSGETIQLVAEFESPNGCYAARKTSFEIDLGHRAVRLTQTLDERDGFCTQAVETLRQDINLGSLPDGRYDIFDGASGTRLGDFEIGGDRPELNRVLTITRARPDLTRGALEIEGLLPSACAQVRAVRTVQDRADVIVVYPEAAGSGEPCSRVTKPFQTRVKIDVDRPTLVQVKNVGLPSINAMFWRTGL